MVMDTSTKNDVVLIIIISLILLISVIGLPLILDNYELSLYRSKLLDEPIISEIRENISEYCNSTVGKWKDYYNKSEYDSIYRNCMVEQAGYYVNKNVKDRVNDTFPEDHFLINKTPSKIMKYGGDCQSKFILWADIIKKYGTTIYVVEQPEHICGLAIIKSRNDEDTVWLYNCDLNEDILNIKKVIS